MADTADKSSLFDRVQKTQIKYFTTAPYLSPLSSKTDMLKLQMVWQRLSHRTTPSPRFPSSVAMVQSSGVSNKEKVHQPAPHLNRFQHTTWHDICCLQATLYVQAKISRPTTAVPPNANLTAYTIQRGSLTEIYLDKRTGPEVVRSLAAHQFGTSTLERHYIKYSQLDDLLGGILQDKILDAGAPRTLFSNAHQYDHLSSILWGTIVLICLEDWGYQVLLRLKSLPARLLVSSLARVDLPLSWLVQLPPPARTRPVLLSQLWEAPLPSLL